MQLLAKYRSSAPLCLLVIALLVPSWLQAKQLSTDSKSTAAPYGAHQTSLDDLKEQLNKAQAKGSKEGQADALYDLANAYFNAHDFKNSEMYMRQALVIEDTLTRPQAAVRTRIALASILIGEKHLDEAESLYEQALRLAEQASLEEQVDAITNNIGALNMVSGHLDEAKKAFEQSEQSAAAHNNPEGQASALVNLSIIARKRKDYAVALQYLDKANMLLSTGEESGTKASVLLESGRAYSDFSSFVPAIACYEKAEKMFEDEGNDIAQAKALFSLGNVYLAQHNSSNAKIVLSKACELLSEPADTKVLTTFLIALGAAEADLGQFTEAQSIHEKALSLSAHDERNHVKALSELGYDNFLQGFVEKALSNFNNAYAILAKLPNADAEKASLLKDIGMCYHSVGQTDAAVKYFEEAAQLFGQIDDSQSQALAYNSAAVAYLDGGQPNKFEIYFAKAKELSPGKANKHSEAYLDYNYAQFCLIEGRFADAIPLFEEARSDYRSVRDIQGESQVLRGLGLLYYSLGRYSKSEEYYKDALSVAQKIGSAEGEWDCSLGLGKVYKAQGQTSLAENNLKRAVELVEKEQSQLARDTFKTFNMDFRRDCFTELADLLVKLNRPEEALEIAEKGRARSFLDLMEGRARGNASSDGVAQVDSSPTLNLDKKEADTSRSTFSFQSTTKAGAVRGGELISHPGNLVEPSAITNVHAEAPTLEEIRALVKTSDSTAIEYFVLPDKILIWVIKPTGEISLAPPVVIDRKNLVEKVRRTYSSIVSRPASMKDLQLLDSQRQENLKDLYKLIIQPVETFLPKSPDAVVMIIPHGPLFSIPFAALIAPNDRLFVEDHTIAYAPAIGVLRATHRLADLVAYEPDRLLALGNPVTNATSNLGSLPYAEKEVKQVAELFGNKGSTVEIGGEATKKIFNELAPQNTILHLATHGIINEERPIDSALVLAPTGEDNGALTVRDILQLPPLKAKLAVLSACQTGRGKITGDGVVGLSRAFVIAGVPSIIVSQWNVDDVMTAFQMEEMYRSYLKGETKAKSLRDAQLKTITFMENSYSASPASAKKLRANPRYWAAFQLIGEYK
jgi:CHAT domain-containing protein/tetratricopeptide (TPR) repeat protein